MRLRRRRRPDSEPIIEFRRLSAELVARMTTVGGSLAEFAEELDTAVARLQSMAENAEGQAGDNHDDRNP